MTVTKQDLWSLLEEANNTPMEPIAGLYQWSLNFDAGHTPFTAFLDIIGWSQEQYGVGLYDWKNVQIGYLELDYLGDALKLYADRPQQVTDFFEQILELEAE